MNVSRRQFLQYAAAHAAILGMTISDLGMLGRALASPTAPTVVWLQGSSCTGCTISFLDFVQSAAPTNAAEVLINVINLAYHVTSMGPSGDTAVALAKQAKNFVLVCEGAVPTAFGGHCCVQWTYKGVEYTHQQVVQDFASRAAKIICVGQCACFGGIQAAAPNPSGAVRVSQATGKTTLNIAGCPAHPDWTVWAITQVLLGNTIAVDSNGRPTALYGTRVHSICPRREARDASFWGQDNRCMEDLGCRGPEAYANCPTVKWNNGQNWCVDANIACINCTGTGFPYSPIIKD
ncbi:[NiFe] hydrogenase small subunit HydA [candidate division BRC1 bacterium HGW-BRC1-1]|jgi:hydrogenase small subunit|nr:MAG: [NiFe] hydrogenase small subunit HydA [candidate division BRC1 bacterium HGW-BRC1-1]